MEPVVSYRLSVISKGKHQRRKIVQRYWMLDSRCWILDAGKQTMSLTESQRKIRRLEMSLLRFLTSLRTL